MINNINLTNKIYNYRFSSKQNFTSKPQENFWVPDLKQYNLPKVGDYYCGPVSAANIMLSLSQKGFTKLYEGDVEKLIYNLGGFMKTDGNGTTSDNLCKGLEAYIKSKGYDCVVTYAGIRPVDAKYKKGEIPDINQIRKEFNDNKQVLLNIGGYKKSVEKGQTIYKRQFGHFLNVTDTGTNGVSADPFSFAVTDPFSRTSGKHYIKFSKINEGKFIHNSDDNEKVLSDNASGFYEFGPSIHYFKPDELGVVDGVIILEMKK